MRIALVHDWLVGIGGAERVLKSLHLLYPNAPIYVLFHKMEFTREFMPTALIHATSYQATYERWRNHKYLILFLPLAVESIDLSEYDLVISTAQFSKGLILKPGSIHINYCASPTRQLWDWQYEYRSESRIPVFFTSVFQHLLRFWDRSASTRVDHYIANSEHTKRRINKYYRRTAQVIYPPVTLPYIPEFQPNHSPQRLLADSFFLIVCRLFKHKNIHLAVKAFSKLGWPLIVIGDGPERIRLSRLAQRGGKFVRFIGEQPDEIVQAYYDQCLAFIQPQEEDFGITAIEAMGHGRPVLALGRGGALEYIMPGINGELFEDPQEEMLADGARRLKANLSTYKPEEIKRTAERFSEMIFIQQISELISKVIPSQQENLSMAVAEPAWNHFSLFDISVGRN